MRVLFSSLSPSLNDDSLRAFTKQSLGFAFGDFGQRIGEVRMELNELTRTDGTPTHCHLFLEFDGAPVAVATLGENPYVAIEEAADEVAAMASSRFSRSELLAHAM